MRNDDLPLCLWAHDVWGWISRNPLEIETWVQWTTNRKWPIGIRMVTRSMTSRDPERSRSYTDVGRHPVPPANFQYSPIASHFKGEKSVFVSHFTGLNIIRAKKSRQRLEIGIRMVTWMMTSRDPERSRSWPQYIWGPLYRQWLEIQTWCQCSTYRKWLPGNQMVTWPMTSPDPERSRSCLNILRAKYLENGWR